MIIKLDEKVALITGSSSGIGASTAILFSSLGGKVVIVGRNQEKLGQVAREVSKKSPKGYKPLVVNADFEKDEDVKKVFDETIATFARLDILVNNAGLVNRKGFGDDGYLEDYDRVMKVNVRAALQLSHLAKPFLIKAKGCIVNVSSISAIQPFLGEYSYCMSKAAMDMMTKTLAQELAPYVRVNSVNPGDVRTNIIAHRGDVEEIYKGIREMVPLKRIGDPIDIANLIAFLSSDVAQFMTGSIVVADAGALVANPSPPAPVKQD